MGRGYLWRRAVDLGTGKGNHIVEPKTSVDSGSREGQPQTRVRPKHGKCRGRFQNSRCNSHIALALKFSEKKIPKRTEIGPLVSVPSSCTSGRISGHSGPDRRWAERGGEGRSYGFAGQNCAGAARSQGGVRRGSAREPGLRLAGNGRGCGTRRKPGWRLRAGRL